MNRSAPLLFSISIIFFEIKVTFQYMPSCSSKVYCQGKILHTVQMMKPFKDSKHFVDMMMKYNESVVLENFNNYFDGIKKPTKHNVKEFVQKNFLMEDELEIWHENDYSENPEFLDRITVKKYQRFAKGLLPVWLFLGRRIKRHILDKGNGQRYSIIPVPNGFVIPGGRFREFYYWDSYWIIVGLLHSGMFRTAKGMIENFLWLVDKYGFIPNGGRVYYLNRSQPPLLLMMIKEYFEVTKDRVWVKKNLPLMEKELQFWLDNKTVVFQVDNKTYTLARYNVDSSTPRPESYSEDYITCGKLKTLKQREKCYRELKSGAESGWDFSSRWMDRRRSLSYMSVTKTIPVDLNSFLVVSFRILSDFYKIVGDIKKSEKWSNIFETWRKNLHDILYNEEDGIWYDFNIDTMNQNKEFYPSNFAPMWVKLFPEQNISHTFGKRALQYLIRHNVFMFDGGIPTSLYETGEQWDLPNAWPPLQSIMILGLKRTEEPNVQRFAKRLAQRWLDVNLALFDQTMVMYEKYNSEFPGEAGGGGEYEVQSGFGWSNGVIFELIGEFFLSERSTLKSSCGYTSIAEIFYIAFVMMILGSIVL